MNKNDLIFKPSVAIAPGETLFELINSLGITQAELSRRMNRPLKVVNEIIKGKSAITPETALQLEQVLGKPASFWNNLEATYQGLRAREYLREQLSSLVNEAEKFPYTEMAGLNWVPRASDEIDRVHNLLSFFSVTSFDNIVEKAALKAAFDVSTKHKKDKPAIYAWLRQGVRQIEGFQTKDFDRSKLISTLPEIKGLTKLSPEEFIPKLTSILSDCGVAFVVVKSITNAPVFGSTRWLASNRALIQLSIRLRWADRFWFSLFHELGHILYGNKKDFNVDFLENNPDGDIEEKANSFARDALVSPEDYLKIVSVIAPRIRAKQPVYPLVNSFAQTLNIHPGIIVGRLQHDGIFPPTFNKLRDRLEWKGGEN